jgi:hypothetical protein
VKTTLIILTLIFALSVMELWAQGMAAGFLLLLTLLE